MIIRVFRARITLGRRTSSSASCATAALAEAVIEPDEEHLLVEVLCGHYETVERG